MKEKTFYLLILICLINIYTVNSETMENSIVGTSCNNTAFSVDTENNPMIITTQTNNGHCEYSFYSPYAGINNITLVFNFYPASYIIIYPVMCTLTDCYLDNYCPSTTHYNILNSLCYSNIGYYVFSLSTGSSGNFYKVNSTIININKTERNIIAGSRYIYPYPLMYRYYSSYFLETFDNQVSSYNYTYHVSDSSSFKNGYLNLDCSAQTNSNDILFNLLQNGSNINQRQLGLFYANVSAIQDFNIKYYYPSNQYLYIRQYENITFSAIPSYSDAVSATVFYYDNSVIKYTLGYGGQSISINFTDIGMHTLELQYEDNFCYRYPTQKWYINVQNSLYYSNTLKVTIYNETSYNGTHYFTVLNKDDITVNLFSNNDSYSESKLTNNGTVYFYDIPNGNYDILSIYNGYSDSYNNLNINGNIFNLIDLSFYYGEYIYTTTSISTTSIISTSSTSSVSSTSSTSSVSSTSSTSLINLTISNYDYTEPTLNYNVNNSNEKSFNDITESLDMIEPLADLSLIILSIFAFYTLIKALFEKPKNNPMLELTKK